jgi:hypothetical protein
MKDSKTILDQDDVRLQIDENNINKELMDQPLLFREYGKMEIEAGDAVRTLEVQLNRVKAKVHLDIMKNAAKFKVKDIENMVEIHADVVKVQDELLEAQSVHEDMRNLIMALRQRHEVLKDISANLRKELGD